MKDRELTLYNKNKIIELVSSMLKYHDNSEYKNEVVKAAHLLMDKVRYCDGENITLEADFIEEILFTLNEDGTKFIVKDVFYYLRSIDADLIGVSFDNVHISGFYFNGLRNVEIDIQKIPNSDISATYLEGVKLIGTLDGANIERTNFTGYIGDLILNPQLVKNKSLYRTHLSGLTVIGSFDNVRVCCMHTNGFKGEIIINPQTVMDKHLWGIDFNCVHLVGDYDEKTGTYSDPCFDGCSLHETSFKGCIGNVVINLDKIYFGAALCNFTGVKLTGKIKNDDGLGLLYSYYEDDNGEKIYLTYDKDNSEEPDREETASEKLTTHKSRIRKENFINRIFGSSNK